MSNIVIESTDKLFEMYFNDYATQTGILEDIIPKTSLARLTRLTDGVTYIQGLSGIDYLLSEDGVDGTMIVDSVNGVAPTDNHHLFGLIEAII